MVRALLIATWNLLAKFFAAFGVVAEVTEEQNAATARVGSGPAFVYTIIEALAQGRTKCGLPSDVSLQLPTQTVLSGAQLAFESKRSPDELIKWCARPAARLRPVLGAMEKLKTSEGLIAAVEAATKAAAKWQRTLLS